ncbi:hypothetical protein EXIGLDRAFT_160450 [Exidia glandulosa HHB12029]|uniref:Xylanolytic transcriptional activator regulatory domain-containing protein n=1 Tax=Exidia glandulosa HHB12029 TaxID=1314781 RepID=A0A166A6V6_EXIGL|nr:hypothetical protein EXIGLDRAFT_160450 [Exidia glandulosa HHB12029]
MKCDAGKPVCLQCQKANRSHDCEYDDGKSKSRTQVMQEKILKQEARIRELETIGVVVGQLPFISSPGAPYPQSPSFFDDAAGHNASFSAATTPQPDPFSLLPPLPTTTTAPSPFASGSTSGSPAATSGTGALASWIDGFDFSQLVDPAAASIPPAAPGADDPFAWATSAAAMGSMLTPPLPAAAVPGWESEDIPLRTRQMLLDIFLKHREQCGLIIHVDRFLQNLQLPLGSPQRPHAALLNCIYLLAAKFSANPSLRAFEPRFFARATEAITAALERSDRLVNIIQAECLLAFYLYSNGRLLEGFYHASAAARLVVGLGLHQITSCDFNVARAPQAADASKQGMPVSWAATSGNSSILPPPLDAVDLGERIHAFWMAFNIDRAWAVATGMPVAFSNDDHVRTQIETVWPRSLSDFESGQVSDAEYATVKNLFIMGQQPQQQQQQRPPQFQRQDSPETLRAKAIALFERASRLSAGLSTARGVNEDFWIEFRAVEFAIHRFSQSLPTVRNAGAGNGTASPAPQGVDHQLALVHTLAYVATIQLHHVFAYMDATSHDKCLVAAGGALAVLRDLGEADARMLDPMLGTAWMCVADVLVREIVRLKQVPGSEQQATSVGMQLLAVVGAMKQLSEVFPIVGFQVAKVQEARSLA